MAKNKDKEVEKKISKEVERDYYFTNEEKTIRATSQKEAEKKLSKKK